MHYCQMKGLPAGWKSWLGLVISFFLAALAGLSTATAAPAAAIGTTLDNGWTNPPSSARLRAYWWWLNGNVTRESITRDLEQMKAKGFGGAVIIDAGGAEQWGNGQVPHGPTFFTPAWRELYKHALREADRLGLEISLNIQSGWNLGGPMVTPDDAAKKLTWSEARVTGPTNFNAVLPAPKEPRQLLPRHVRHRLPHPAGSSAASAASKLAREGVAQNARTVFHAGHRAAVPGNPRHARRGGHAHGRRD
jgi:hypothetical protein